MKGEVYIVSGRTGAGKTTVSKKLEKHLPAFRFSHDELLLDLYGKSIDDLLFRECCERVNTLIWKQVQSLTMLGISVVIEGFGTRKLREVARYNLKRMDVVSRFIFVECPQSIRLERVMKRNLYIGQEGVIISEEDFYRMEGFKEEFDDDEEYIVFDNSLGCFNKVFEDCFNKKASD